MQQPRTPPKFRLFGLPRQTICVWVLPAGRTPCEHSWYLLGIFCWDVLWVQLQRTSLLDFLLGAANRAHTKREPAKQVVWTAKAKQLCLGAASRAHTLREILVFIRHLSLGLYGGYSYSALRCLIFPFGCCQQGAHQKGTVAQPKR